MFKILLMLVIMLSSICYADTTIVTNFDQAMILSQETKMPVLVIFGAEYCGHCKTLIKDIKRGIFDDNIDKYIVCYIDTQTNKELASSLGIKSIPDSRIFVNQKEILKLVGYNKREYERWLKNANTK